ncbi:MAG TPA: hypothetical protein ENI77_02370 [Nitrospirae bacterium]|nr:hypothetical protein [Nitrospirota bacterium]
MNDWYVAYVRFQNEFSVAKILEDHYKLDTCVPIRKLLRNRGGKKLVVQRPLLDTYVFFRSNLFSFNLSVLHKINGFTKIVRGENGPALAPDEQVRSLDTFGRSERPIHEVEYKRISPNESIEVIAGPLKGAIGYYKKSDERTGQLLVNIDLFHRSMETTIEAHLVRPY